ncbi:MAG: sulfite exporter TauE/SafE family protein [Microthrixaceae bacterium]
MLAGAAAWIDPGLVVGGLLGGFTMGLTGMGGGALLTPMLVLVFGVSPTAAVGSDLVTSLAVKPFGGAIHARAGTVRWDLVRWLALGSVPGALAGVALLSAVGERGDSLVQVMLGLTLLAAASVMVWRARHPVAEFDGPPTPVRPLPTVALGLVGGTVVGLTSVGSGSLMIAVLTLLYPRLKRSELVGTDLVQAIPLVGAAAIAHLGIGSVSAAVTGSLIVGSLPGIVAGARVSSRYDGRLVRAAIPAVLGASALKLLGVL